MDKQEASDLIIRGLHTGQDRAEVVRALCEQTGWPRKHVEGFVQQVESSDPVVSRLPRQQPQRADGATRRELEQFVIAELSKHRSRDDVVRELCEQIGWTWRKAERFVRVVEIEHHARIAARQSPIIILLGVGIILGGLLLDGAAAYLTYHGQAINLSGMPVPYLENVLYFATGVAMILGGVAGVWRAVSLLRGWD